MIQQTNLWPAEPGVPLNPNDNGAHMLTHVVDTMTRGPWVLLWCAPERLWTDLFGNRMQPDKVAPFRYIGPMTPPANHSIATASPSAKRQCGTCKYWGPPGYVSTSLNGTMKPCVFPVPTWIAKGWTSTAIGGSDCMTWESAND